MDTDLGRALVSSVISITSDFEFGNHDAFKTDFFCKHREIGILNFGSAGTVTVDGAVYQMGAYDRLSEVCYFDVPAAHRVIRMMGELR